MPTTSGHNPNMRSSDLPSCLLVVGSTIAAERIDRLCAAEMAPRLAHGWGFAHASAVQTVTDFLYLEDPLLFALPAICLGPADRNAATAHLLGRIDRVQTDPRGFSIYVNVLDTPARAQLIAADLPAMVACCECFEARFAPGFMTPVVKRRAA